MYAIQLYRFSNQTFNNTQSHFTPTLGYNDIYLDILSQNWNVQNYQYCVVAFRIGSLGTSTPILILDDTFLRINTILTINLPNEASDQDSLYIELFPNSQVSFSIIAIYGTPITNSPTLITQSPTKTPTTNIPTTTPTNPTFITVTPTISLISTTSKRAPIPISTIIIIILGSILILTCVCMFILWKKNRKNRSINNKTLKESLMKQDGNEQELYNVTSGKNFALPNNEPDIIDSTEGNNIDRDGNIVTLNEGEHSVQKNENQNTLL